MSPTTYSYHDVIVEFGDTRIRLFDASGSLRLTCTRAAGWELWSHYHMQEVLLAGEFERDTPLKIFVGDVQICGAVEDDDADEKVAIPSLPPRDPLVDANTGFDFGDWAFWFAWYPVRTPQGMTWFSSVLRRSVRPRGGPLLGYLYQTPEYRG